VQLILFNHSFMKVVFQLGVCG